MLLQFNDVFHTLLLMLAAIVTIIVTYGVFSIIMMYKRARHIGKYINKLPGPPIRPLVGTAYVFPDFYEGFLTGWHEFMNTHGYRRALRQWLGPLAPTVSVFHPETIKIMMKSTQPKRTDFDNSSFYTFMRPWLGDGLLTSSGKKWARNRRLLTPAFHFDILKGYIPVYNRASDVLMENLKRLSASQESVELFECISLCTLDVILKCAFSYEGDIQDYGKENQYVNTVKTVGYLLVERFMNPLLRPDILWALSAPGRRSKKMCDLAHKVSEEVIAKRKKALTDDPDITNKRYLDFLDILLSARDEEGQGLTDLEIRDEVDTFLFEGHDTTASAISWTLYSMASHPDIQKKAREEVDDLLNGRESDSLVWDDLSKLPYLTLCIKEALRLWSPVPHIARQLESDVEIMGVTIPTGTYVDLSIYPLHHNPDVWGDDHMDFKPERMHIDNIKHMDSYSYVPFSAGPRNCIGQNFAMNEVKTVVGKVLRRFVLSAIPEMRPIPHPSMVMRAKEGIHVKLTARDL